MLKATFRTSILTALVLILLTAGLSFGQTTVYNNFGPDHDGWDYNWGLGWTVAGIHVIQQYGVEQAMSFQNTVDGTLSDIWVAFWYVPISAYPDTVTFKIARNPNLIPPVEDDILEEWVLTDFESWSQWNPPIHLEGNGTTMLNAGDHYWLWAVASDTTWTGWCMNSDPGLTGLHAMRREGEDWLIPSAETASAFRVDVLEGVQAPSITLSPYNTPIQIPAGGGSFAYNAFVENSSADPVTFDAWTEAVGPNGNTYGPVDMYPDRVFPAGHSVSLNLMQNVPWMIYAGTYTFRACVGTYPGTVIDSDEFTFEKLAVPTEGTIDDWSSSGWNWASDADAETAAAIPSAYCIDAVYPNPFNPVTTVSITLPEAAELNLTVLNTLGQQVATLAQGQHAAGRHTFTFDGSALSSGVYFVRLDVPGVASDLQKMMLMK
ncbi:T9SS type A sorting domain-containing protein [bacterium]|nr:T9SS type A sorting domain-containing protein [bacterium]